MQRCFMALSFCLTGMISSTSFAYDLVYANPTIVPNDRPYYTSDVRNTRLIYTEQNRPFAEYVAGLEEVLQPQYEATFGYTLNERLYVGLTSDFNQIANGFSTQFPVNRQINYVGGALTVDYFTTASWLDTLIYHETAHNYQTNPRDNAVSETLYSILGVGSFPTPLVPAITPNLFESSFILEGNAVLNESWHGNGGRLYNGRMKAMTLLQARAGKLTPNVLYNRPLRFPYGESYYILGGYFQYYLAQRYDLDQTNSYFLNRSRYWYWPLLVTSPTLDTFGDTFENLIADWSNSLAEEAEGLVMADGDPIATSVQRFELTSNDDEIHFLVNESGVRAPDLVTINRHDLTTSRTRREFQGSKVVLKDGDYYTLSGAHTSPLRITQGLFDDDNLIAKDTKGRIVQGYLSDGRAVYFDVPGSYDKPQLYVGDALYGEVSSSVLIGKDDALYYFVQQGRERTLYRNHTPMLTLDGYYGIVADVDTLGRVYFIANTEHGSGLYRFDGKKTERLSPADNIAEARLVDDDTVLVAAVGAEGYYYVYEPIQPTSAQPYRVQLLWDHPVSDRSADHTLATAQSVTSTTNTVEPVPLTLDEPYSSIGDIRYQGTDVSISSVTTTMRNGEEEDHLIYTINATFSDPLTQNTLNLFALRDTDLSNLAGIGYTNSQFPVFAGFQVYGVIDEQLETLETPDESRGYGLNAELKFPYLQVGYWYGELRGFHHLDYREREREPTGLDLVLSRETQFGFSMFPNSQFIAEGFAVDDRGDHVTGGLLTLSTDFPWEIYAGINSQYAYSDADNISQMNRRGVNLENIADPLVSDPSILVIPGLKDSTYASEAAYGELKASKVFNGDAYAFWFPLSLRREALTLRYRHVNVNDSTRGGDVDFDQYAAALTADIVTFNILPLLATIEYVHSDETPMTDKNSFNFQLGFAF